MPARCLPDASIMVAVLCLVSCGGGSNAVWPDTHGGTRILGIDFGTKVPSLIAFSRASEVTWGSARDLFVMFPDGTHEKRLTSNTADDDFPAFSPNGLALAFVSNMGGLDWGNHDVWRLDTPKRIAELTDDNWEFDSSATDWGPDCVITARLNTIIGAPFDFVGLWRIDPAGKWIEPIATGFIASYDPCVSRDGSMIAFCARLNCPSEEDPGCTGTLQLFILREGEKTPEQVTDFGGSPRDPILVRHPAFDFAGTRIVFQTTYWSEDWEIGYIRLGGQGTPELYRLTDNPADDMQPCFDPSGLWIAFASDRDGNFEIYKTWDVHTQLMIPVPSETTVRLTHTPQDEQNPDWSPGY